MYMDYVWDCYSGDSEVGGRRWDEMRVRMKRTKTVFTTFTESARREQVEFALQDNFIVRRGMTQTYKSKPSDG